MARKEFGSRVSETTAIPLLAAEQALNVKGFIKWCFGLHYLDAMTELGSKPESPSNKLKAYFKLPVISEFNKDRLIVTEGVDFFLMAKFLGVGWIRVQMPKKISEKWDSRSTENLRAVIEQTKRTRLYAPILHEDFRSMNVSRSDSIRLDRFRRLLGCLGQGLCGLDIGCNIGHMSHHMQRQGFAMTGIDFDEFHLLVAYALNETYGLDVKFLKCNFLEFESAYEYDITWALTVLCHIFFSEGVDPAFVARRVGQLTKSALFWESGSNPEAEKELILTHSGLSKYLSLGPTKGTGLKRQLGIFLRPGTKLAKDLIARYKKIFG